MMMRRRRRGCRHAATSPAGSVASWRRPRLGRVGTREVVELAGAPRYCRHLRDSWNKNDRRDSWRVLGGSRCSDRSRRARVCTRHSRRRETETESDWVLWRWRRRRKELGSRTGDDWCGAGSAGSRCRGRRNDAASEETLSQSWWGMILRARRVVRGSNSCNVKCSPWRWWGDRKYRMLYPCRWDWSSNGYKTFSLVHGWCLNWSKHVYTSGYA